MMTYHSDRDFQLWDFNVSHKQMLLRSPQTPNLNTNVDVIAWGVKYLDLPTYLRGLTIAPATLEDVAQAGQALGCPPNPSDVFCFTSCGRSYLMVADGFKVLLNELDIFESSLEYFQEPAPMRDLGEVLARS